MYFIGMRNSVWLPKLSGSHVSCGSFHVYTTTGRDKIRDLNHLLCNVTLGPLPLMTAVDVRGSWGGTGERAVLCRVYTRRHVAVHKRYPLVAINMFLVSAIKLSPVCRPSVAGYKGIQVNRDIDE